MAVDRFSITLDDQLGTVVRKAAERSGVSLSAWMAAAAADRVRNDLLGEALDQWEAEDGAFTEAELREAAASLQLPPVR
jgi:hypothetical protein